MRLHFSVDLPEEVALLSKLRRTVRDALTLCRVDPQDIDELELLVGELASNAACHSCTELYTVDLKVLDGKVITTVADTGTGFERAAVPQPGSLRVSNTGRDGNDRIGGFGLPLVELLADEVSFMPVHPQGTCVRAVKFLRA
jgi:anti-sigma regulatory factor (Ser/Thr protein kinase)